MANAINWYNKNAESLAIRYEEIDPEFLHGWLINLLPSERAMILDIGAGTGRDAAWLASKGHEVVAVEPSAAMRDVANRLHPGSSIQWVNDSLPSLTGVTRSGATFDVVLLSAVWMHVPDTDRVRAFRKLVNLLKPGGMLALTLRHGPAEKERGMHEVSLSEIEVLARDHGFVVERTAEHPDHQERKDVHWTQVALRLPDDGTGALPLLRHVILNDQMSSTYKLALLRVLCRIADGAAGFSHDYGDKFVSIPLGLVALVWLRLYKPLLAADLPQNPNNIGLSNLAFVKAPFKKLMVLSHLDFRVGMVFSSKIGEALHGALKDAANTIEKMPAHHITYPNGEQIFPINKDFSLLKIPDRTRLDEAYLFSFGEMLVPRHFWRALQRFDVWVEPALVAEWTRLIKAYAKHQERIVSDGTISAAMVWDEPSHDVQLAKKRAIALIERNKLYCVWSGKRLGQDMLDVDHCLPWASWPCGDLWNLMPAHRNVNRNQKRARLPSDRVLRLAQDRIIYWWDRAYTDTETPLPVREQFWIEARSSLPGVEATKRNLPDIFDALCLQRMRLKHDQQAPEWEGEKQSQN